MTPEDEHNRTQADIDAMRASSERCTSCQHPKSAHGFGGCTIDGCECLLHHVHVPPFHPIEHTLRSTLLALDARYSIAYLLLPDFAACIDTLASGIPQTLRAAFEIGERRAHEHAAIVAKLIEPPTLDVNAVTNAAAEAVLIDQHARLDVTRLCRACGHRHASIYCVMYEPPASVQS